MKMSRIKVSRKIFIHIVGNLIQTLAYYIYTALHCMSIAMPYKFKAIDQMPSSAKYQIAFYNQQCTQEKAISSLSYQLFSCQFDSNVCACIYITVCTHSILCNGTSYLKKSTCDIVNFYYCSAKLHKYFLPRHFEELVHVHAAQNENYSSARDALAVQLSREFP